MWEGIGMFVRIQMERASMPFDIDFVVKSEIMSRSINFVELSEYI